MSRMIWFGMLIGFLSSLGANANTIPTTCVVRKIKAIGEETSSILTLCGGCSSPKCVSCQTSDLPKCDDDFFQNAGNQAECCESTCGHCCHWVHFLCYRDGFKNGDCFKQKGGRSPGGGLNPEYCTKIASDTLKRVDIYPSSFALELHVAVSPEFPNRFFESRIEVPCDDGMTDVACHEGSIPCTALTALMKGAEIPCFYDSQTESVKLECAAIDSEGMAR